MTNKILKIGDIYKVANEEAIKSFDKLPPQNYTIKYNEMVNEYFLEVIAPFRLPKKLYGDLVTKANRILATYYARPDVTGVLLEGTKGSGKTLLAKYVSHIALEDSIPTVVVNQPFSGDVFNQFIQGLGDNVIVIFDEFEKVYRPENQEKVLTLLDGVYPSKKLFFLTINSVQRIDGHLLNRPGRIYYKMSYGNLSSEFIREYCEDALDNKDNMEAIIIHAKVFSSFNFDMLQSVIEEMNRYKETFHEVLNVLNVDPKTNDGYTPYTVHVDVDNTGPVQYGSSRFIDIQQPDIYLDVDDLSIPNPTEALKIEIEKCTGINVESRHLVGVDMDNDTFTYETVCGPLPVVITVQRQDPYSQKADVLETALGYENKQVPLNSVSEVTSVPAPSFVRSLRSFKHS